MQQLIQHLSKGTERTQSGKMIGIEIETDFLTDSGTPIEESVTKQLLSLTPPAGYSLKLELGRQKLELNVDPQPTFEQLWDETLNGLAWLYDAASRFGAKPYFQPELNWSEELLFVQEERDELWVNIDGRLALEELCRCSSVQFTIDVNPAEAIDWINHLHRQQIQLVDYSANDRRMRRYIELTRAPYRTDRYGGPTTFANLEHYCSELTQHMVVMHQGSPIWRPCTMLDNLDVDLFLRSIWWHYRLRRYGQSLALEIRPFSRRKDSDIPTKWQLLQQALNL